MARSWFGVTPADWSVTLGPDGTLRAAAATITAWDAAAGGARVTDLLDGDGQPCDHVTATSGQWRFQGPDGVTSLWVQASNSGGAGERELVTAVPDAIAAAARAAVADAVEQALAGPRVDYDTDGVPYLTGGA